MSIEGRIAVDVSFADAATGSGVQSLKKIQLTDAQAYTMGKVAIVTGTVGTAEIQLSIAPSDYRDAGGESVSFSNVSRVAFCASPSVRLTYTAPVNEGQGFVVSSSNLPAVVQCNEGDSFGVVSLRTAGTASYTLVLYGT